MNRLLFIILAIGSFVCISTLAMGNPSMLPNHPGYPMGAAKDPVSGQSVANDPGQSPPSQQESLQQAGSFHDAHSVTPGKEERANIVPPGTSTSIEAQSESTK
jgi:hypothetical protein